MASISEEDKLPLVQLRDLYWNIWAPNCSFQPILYWRFWTLSGIYLANCSWSGPNSVHTQLKGRQRSPNFGRDWLSGGEMGLGRVPDAGFFLFVSNTRQLFGNFATVDFHQIWPWHVNRCETQILDRNLWKFPFRGHLPPKPQTWRGTNRHLTQSRLQVKACTADRYCLLHVVVQRLGSTWDLVSYHVR